MGEQMTREQIESWLAIEGWYFANVGCPGIQHDATEKCYLLCRLADGYPIVSSGAYLPNRPQEAIPEQYKEYIQLIYQEIIKHEKD